eukprot:962155-Amphidinium_carterae.1
MGWLLPLMDSALRHLGCEGGAHLAHDLPFVARQCDALSAGLVWQGLQQVTKMSVTKDVFEEFIADKEASCSEQLRVLCSSSQSAHPRKRRVKSSIQCEVCKILERLDVPEEERLDIFEVIDANGNGTIQLD